MLFYLGFCFVLIVCAHDLIEKKEFVNIPFFAKLKNGGTLDKAFTLLLDHLITLSKEFLNFRAQYTLSDFWHSVFFPKPLTFIVTLFLPIVEDDIYHGLPSFDYLKSTEKYFFEFPCNWLKNIFHNRGKITKKYIERQSSEYRCLSNKNFLQ